MLMVRRNIRQTVRNWQWLAVVAMAILLGLAAPAHASVQEIHVVGAGIDSSSLKAEELALDYVKKRAVYLGVRKLGVKNASAVAAKLTEQQLSQIIRGVNVVQTKRDKETTYIEANVTIVDEQLLRALRLPDNYSKPPAPDFKVRGVLLLPVFVGPERAYLWEKENILKPVLSDEVRRQSYGGVLLPGGNFEDLRLIDYQNALTVKADELGPMFDRYGAEEIVIAVLTLSHAGTADSSSVLLRRLAKDKSRNEVLDIPAESPEETKDVRLSKAASAIAAAVTQIATSTSENDLELRRNAKQIKVAFRYTIPRDLARMADAVRKAPQVLSLELPTIALAQVAGTIYLKGDEAELKAGLSKQGIIVTPVEGGWRLTVR